MLLFLQLWDLSQRCEARKHSHQSEMHRFSSFALQERNHLLLSRAYFSNYFVQLAAKRSEARRLRLVSERVLQAPPHGVHFHALVQSPGVPPH